MASLSVWNWLACQGDRRWELQPLALCDDERKYRSGDRESRLWLHRAMYAFAEGQSITTLPSTCSPSLAPFLGIIFRTAVKVHTIDLRALVTPSPPLALLCGQRPQVQLRNSLWSTTTTRRTQFIARMMRIPLSHKNEHEPYPETEELSDIYNPKVNTGASRLSPTG